MNTKIIACANASGSAGKTTSVVSLAVLMAQTGRSVVVVDADPQANATSWLGVVPDDLDVTLADVMTGKAGVDQVILDTATPRLRLIPSNRALDAVPTQLNASIGREQKLRKALAGVAADVILIDCPGAIGLLTINALTAATALVTVTQSAPKEIEGIPDMLDTCQDVQDAYNPQLRFDGIIPCIMPASNGGKVYRDALQLLAKSFPDQVSPVVRRSATVATAYGRKVPLPVFAPDADVTADYKAVLTWLEQRGTL